MAVGRPTEIEISYYDSNNKIITYLDGNWDEIGHILYIKDRYYYLHKLGY